MKQIAQGAVERVVVERTVEFFWNAVGRRNLSGRLAPAQRVHDAQAQPRAERLVQNEIQLILEGTFAALRLGIPPCIRRPITQADIRILQVEIDQEFNFFDHLHAGFLVRLGLVNVVVVFQA